MDEMYKETLRLEQEDFEQQSFKIVEGWRDYPGFRSHMNALCKVITECTSPMCPLDSRLNPKEKEDALFCCSLQNRRPVTVSNALTTFVRKYCANWQKLRPDPYNPSETLPEKLCVAEYRTGTCLIMQGKPCEYFKKAVFPICDPSYKFALETKKYQKLIKLYQKIDHGQAESKSLIRKCQCGIPLKPRERCCDKCRVKRRRKTKRKSQRKFRSHRSTVPENRPSQVPENKQVARGKKQQREEGGRKGRPPRNRDLTVLHDRGNKRRQKEH